MLLNWQEIALDIYNKLKSEIPSLKRKPSLWVILLWNDSSSIRYIDEKRKWASYVGIDFRLEKLSEHASEDELLALIDSFNKDKNIDWFIVQLPLPFHIDKKNILLKINPDKDVDGFHPLNIGKLFIWDDSGFLPCTAAWVIELLDKENIDYSSKKIVVIWRWMISWKPIAAMLINKWATLTICNSKTHNIRKFTSDADIIISAAWKPWLLSLDMIKTNSIVIDVGFTLIDGKIYWDADTKNIDLVGIKISPVPNWVWPLTVAMLMKNTFKAYHKNN